MEVRDLLVCYHCYFFDNGFCKYHKINIDGDSVMCDDYV
jgi:hypothetical protein